MTKTEYDALYRQARKTYPNLTRSAMTEIRRTYKAASNSIAKQIKDAELAGKAFTPNSLTSIQRQLDEAVELVNIRLGEGINKTTRAGLDKTADINLKYLSESFAAVGSSRVTAAGLSEMYVGVNEKVIESIINKVYQDGYKLSERIWKAGQDYKTKINSVITEGLAQGRSTIQIAKDVQKYTADGKIALANRYGPNLTRGTKEFLRRIGDKVDYRSLRLVRSVLYDGLQEATAEQGRSNPGTNGWYDWVLESGRQHWKCDCPDIASNSPYKYERIPAYPHPNCRCDIRPQLRDVNKFNADLKKWVGGGDVPYMDDWYHGTYLK